MQARERSPIGAGICSWVPLLLTAGVRSIPTGHSSWEGVAQWALGLAWRGPKSHEEVRSGVCLGTEAAASGAIPWEAQHPALTGHHLWPWMAPDLSYSSFGSAHPQFPADVRKPVLLVLPALCPHTCLGFCPSSPCHRSHGALLWSFSTCDFAFGFPWHPRKLPWTLVDFHTVKACLVLLPNPKQC